MDDETVIEQINRLAAEEHDLWEREARGEASDAQRERAKPHAENHGRDRQRRKSLVGCEHRADDAGCGNDHRVVSASKRLRDRQDYGVASCEVVIVLGVLERFGGRRHE